MDKNNYESALEEFQGAMEIFQCTSMKMDEARARRMVGEVYLKQGKYHDALKCVRRYLKVAKEENDKVEEQRAHTTLARCYMMIVDESSIKGEDVVKSEEYKAADRELLKALLIAKE